MKKKKDKPTRIITPYKGGRSESLTVRLTGEEKALITNGASDTKVSIPDYIMTCVEFYQDSTDTPKN